ncbi:MAG TPA: C4-type zinc ribbon domain-containing protein [Candidatus Omnitrophota bacterium]|nr:C4-type zinc ribbon domain-containing protein [Candidatus Omnitrophota bacterium]
MAEIAIKDQIRKMIELQKIDREIYNLKIDLKEKPAMLADLKAEFESQKVALEELEKKLKAVLVERKEKELELKTREDEIAKANAQLSQIKTNKEYSAKMSEIEHIKADKSIIEEKILVSYDKSDSVAAEVEKERGKVAEEEKKYLAAKKTIEDDIKVIEDRIKVFDSQRKQALPGIDPALLARYEKILKHKEGVAIVPVQGQDSCGGCFMNVTPQQVNAIKMHQELIECEMCSRILYLEDDL